jgi:hypothetical protein
MIVHRADAKKVYTLEVETAEISGRSDEVILAVMGLFHALQDFEVQHKITLQDVTLSKQDIPCQAMLYKYTLKGRA